MSHRIVAIETHHRRPQHAVIVRVSTLDNAATTHESWSVSSVLKAMNGAERFYSQAPNGQRARVQRYTCGSCHEEHIRTHINDAAIHDLTDLGPAPIAVESHSAN